MAKGAKRKTKWVSLSLASANTTTSGAIGSDSELSHHQQQHYGGTGGGGHRQKTLNGTSTTTRHSSSKEATGGTDSTEKQHHSNEPLDQSGNRTDTSASSNDGITGNPPSERRPEGGAYYRRRPPTYHTRSSWNGGGTGTATNGRGSYNGGNRTGYYNGGSAGGGYYGAARRSHYDTHTRRPTSGTGTNKTTSVEGGTTINDDEYTRITTPRQDVLFKKGYLSRPKPSTVAASTSNENTASSSVVGTTSEGSDGGSGVGSNSISTTESITSEYGGSYAADGSPLFDYPYPLVPCGYFTENGVLVMNGFAVDNNGYSYFNGGQTYIYPPNFSNGQQQQPSTGGLESTDPMPFATNDETNANITEDQPSTAFHSTLGTVVETVATAEDSATPDVACSVDVGAGGDCHASAALEQCEPDGCVVQPVLEEAEQHEALQSDGAPVDSSVAGNGVAEGEPAVVASQEVADFENGFYQFNDGYDFAQFYSSIYYPNWLMEQYRLYDDAGGPMYCGGEYTLPNGDVYTHQTSFKRRKKRFRTFEEIPGETGAPYDLEDMSGAVVHEIDPVSGIAVPVSAVPSSGEASHEYQLNVEVQEFQPSTTATPLPNGVASSAGDKCSSDSDVVQPDQNRPPRVTKKPPIAVKLPKSSSKAVVASEPNGTATVAAPSARPAAMSHKIRKKDLIESTLAFEQQNIDLTRPKALVVASAVHASELDCWTTVDRNGRKKRMEKPEQPNPKGAANASIAKEKKVATNQCAVRDEQPSAVVKVLPPKAVEAAVTTPTAVEASISPSLGVTQPDASNKKDQQNIKSKKKTKPNKRQQNRKSLGGFHKQQKQEGFQLIEPEFPSVTAPVVHQPPKSCDSDDTDDHLEEDIQDEQQIEEPIHRVERERQENPAEGEEKNQPDNVSQLEVVLEQNAEETCFAEKQITSVELKCDKANETDKPAGTHPEEVSETQRERVAQDLVLTTLPQLSWTPSVVVEDKIVVNETETEGQPRQNALGTCGEHLSESRNVQEVEVVKQEVKPMERTPYNVEQSSVALFVDVQMQSESASNDDVVVQEEQEATDQPSCELPSSLVGEPVPEEEQPDELQPTAVEEQRMEMCVDRNVLTSAAKQLALGERPNLLLPAAKDNAVEDGEVDIGSGDGPGSEEDESRGKRGSVSGGGYTESIDSGLQSPAPCGGVASPEASSMVSSIESDETTLGGQPQAEAQLSQIVARWLLRKLEVHEPEEVFVLPSDPLLIQRLERFQLLQRRSCRLRGAASSDSEEDDDLDDGSQGDTDSDYMSDGQGRLDRFPAGQEGGETGPSSPFVVGQKALPSGTDGPSPTDNDAASTRQLNAKITHAPVDAGGASKQPVPSSSDKNRISNSQADALRGGASASAADSKRCVIM